jgi:hypothetical protein
MFNVGDNDLNIFDIGDKVVCINDEKIFKRSGTWSNKPVRIKFGGQYIIYRVGDDESYELCGIEGICYDGRRFVSLPEYRKMAIKKLKDV